MFGPFARPRPSPRIARAVWLWGTVITVALWAAAAGAFATAGELDVVGHGKLAGAFALVLAGWSGGWLYTRRSVTAGPTVP